jgi:transcription termination factor NusB
VRRQPESVRSILGFTMEPMYLIVGALLAVIGVYFLVMDLRKRSADRLAQLHPQASKVKREDQVRSAQDARACYTKLGPKLYDPDKSVFDSRMLSLFDSIEENREDIDARIEDLHQLWRRESFWQRRMDKMKLNLLLGAVVQPNLRHWWRTSASIGQLQENWMRVAKIVNGHRFSQFPMAASWIGPPPNAPPSVEKPTITKS